MKKLTLGVWGLAFSEEKPYKDGGGQEGCYGYYCAVGRIV